MNLEIRNVWTKVTPELAQEVIDFWQSHNLLKPETNAIERSKQIVLTVRHQEKIVGLTSAGLIKYHQLNDNIFFLFRMVVLPGFQVPGIGPKLLVETEKVLEDFASKQEVNKPIGILTFVENPELIAKRAEAIWPASKMVFIGNDKSGRPIRVYYFKGATI